MRTPDDLHPDDQTARTVLLAQLVATRKHRGLTCRDLDAALGVGAGNASSFERRITWEARTVQRYARALGLRLNLHLHRLPVPGDADVMDALYQAADTSTPHLADRTHLRTVCNNLVRVRRHHVSAAEMGRRLAVHAHTVYWWEANPDGSSILAAQRYARALGGHLTLTLTPGAAHTAPRQRAAA